jgi:hypothetical protein
LLRTPSTIVLAALCAAGCGQVFLPPPEQRVEAPHPVRELLDMTGGRPEESWGSIVSGIDKAFQPGADWRWATEHSVFRFTLGESEGWSLAVRLTGARAVLDQTGPQRVAFSVNGHAAGTATVDADRTYRLSFPVDAAVLKSATPIVVTMDAGPCLSQPYGPPYCVLLHNIGFEQEPR